MRNLLPSFYDLTEDEKRTLWTHGTFVFDTNVLLSLTAFGLKQRTDALNAIRNLNGSIWIPYQVAVEFTDNRMVRIVDQAKRARAWQSAIETALQGIGKAIDSNQEKAWDVGDAAIEFKQHTDGLSAHFKQTLSAAVDRYVSDIQASPTSVFDEIETIFADKVGPAPKSAEEIAALTRDADERYRLGIPPGFADKTKDDSAQSHRTISGVTYKKSHSDLIIWRQIITHAKTAKLKYLVLITDDVKVDWSLNKSEARRELREEALAHGVRLFQTTTLANFFTGLQHFRQAVVADETVEVAREIGRDRTDGGDLVDDMRYEAARQSVVDWLKGGSAGMALTATSYSRWARNTAPAILYDILPFAFVPSVDELHDAIITRMHRARNFAEASHSELVVSIAVDPNDRSKIAELTEFFRATARFGNFPWDVSAVRTIHLGIELRGKFYVIARESKSSYTDESTYLRSDLEDWQWDQNPSRP